jgi:DNA-binding winged helix-turn-helix (wHTH) protein
VELRLLGPFEVVAANGQLITFARRRDRCLLAILLMYAGQMVSVDRLIELLWDGEPPSTARAAVQTSVSRVRSALRREPAPKDVELITLDEGYLLRVPRERVDVHRFRALVARARATAGASERAEYLRAAVALWRGDALVDAATATMRDRLCTELEELRLTAIEDRATADLGWAGTPRSSRSWPRWSPNIRTGSAWSVRTCSPCTAAGVPSTRWKPSNSGRSGCATSWASSRAPRCASCTCRSCGTTPPGPRPGVDRTVRGAEQSWREQSWHEQSWREQSFRPTPAQLPADVPEFIGRQHTCGAARRAGLGHRRPGLPDRRYRRVGKTALAVRWGHQVRARFPDGQLYVDLAGYSPRRRYPH